jgi:hypothetical protein
MVRLAVLNDIGYVVNIIQGNTSNDIIDGYTLIPNNNAQIGHQFQFSNNEWNNITPIINPTFEELKEQKLNDLSEKLAEYENDGVLYNGNIFKTDSAAQLKFVAVTLSTMMDSNYSVDFKTRDGIYVTLNSTQAIELCLAVKTHIQSCYSNEGRLINLINQCTNTSELNSIDLESGWPAI